MRRFKLGPITKLDEDDDKDSEHLQLPLTLAINGNANYVETETNVLKVSGNLQSEIRGFIRVLFKAVYIICKALCDMDINAIAEHRNTAYTSGTGE